MKNCHLIKPIVFFILLSCFFPQLAMAYVGPGAGLSAIGAFLAVVAGVIVAIFGFVWYPIRRLIRKWKKSKNNARGGKTE